MQIENSQLILFTKDDIPKYLVFNKFRYLFELFNKLALEEKDIFQRLFSTFFNSLYTNYKGDQFPYRNQIAKQIINKEPFFKLLQNLLYSKLKNKESFIRKEYLDNFLSIYMEVIKMQKDYLDIAKNVGENIGFFSQKVEYLEPVYKLRELSTKSSFLETLRNIQFKATKSKEMIFSNELLDKLQETLFKQEKEFKDFLNITAIYAVQKYLSINYAKQKSKGGQK